MDQLRSVFGGPGLNTKIKLLRIRRVIKGRGGNPPNLNYSITITKKSATQSLVFTHFQGKQCITNILCDAYYH